MDQTVQIKPRKDNANLSENLKLTDECGSQHAIVFLSMEILQIIFRIKEYSDGKISWLKMPSTFSSNWHHRHISSHSINVSLNKVLLLAITFTKPDYRDRGGNDKPQQINV